MSIIINHKNAEAEAKALRKYLIGRGLCQIDCIILLEEFVRAIKDKSNLPSNLPEHDKIVENPITG